jgi:NTE family protein
MEEKLQVLQSVPIIASLGDAVMNNLAERAEFVTARKGELVVRENDAGDALYAVVSGRLQAYTRLKSGAERIYTTYCSGDYFGEMPLLSGETQWASVRALNDSILLKIPRDDFQSVLRDDPRMALGFLRRMGHRITELREEKHRAKWSTIIALYSAAPGTGKTLLANNLVASLARETGEPVVLLDFSGRQRSVALARCEGLSLRDDRALDELVAHHPLGYDHLHLELTSDEKEIRMIAPLFGHLVKRYDFVLVDLPDRSCPAVFECLVQADRIFLATRNMEESLAKTRVLLQDLRSHDQPLAAKTRIILTGVNEASATVIMQAREKVGHEIGYLLRWIPEGEIVESVDGVPYVLRRPMEPYSLVVRRVARELGNVLVGLALGTGAARGFAHIGVIRVLEQAGIAVDVVAGSSMGALIGAAWAVGKSADEMEQIALRVKGKRAFLKLLDPVFPGSGLMRGRRVYDFLGSIVDGLTFEDTLVPLKIVASDLNTMEEVVFEQGKLIDAIRASISIPGIFRPVQHKGHTLIDGGITDPVPAHVLAHAGVSKIIAVNTIPTVDDMKQRRAAPRLPAASTEGMRETGPLIETPTSIINIYMLSMYAMQTQIAERACAIADVVIRPILSSGVWYDFYNPERYIQCGEVAATAALPRLQELVQTTLKR